MPEARKPLSGLKVIDFTTVVSGPHCTRLLVDCGAEVIKIESETGDLLRYLKPHLDGISTYFAHLNCGKKSVVLDLASDDGKAKAKKLISGAHVVVENFRPGVMKRLGLDYETLSANQPDLIYCAISGFGQTGPKSKEPAYAPIVHAASGYDMTQMEVQEGATQPAICGTFTADVVAGVYAFGAIQTALLGKATHGDGQFIDVAMNDSMISMMIMESQIAQTPLEQPRILYGPTKTADGFIVIAPVSQRNFWDMADAMGHSEWKTNPRFAEMDTRRSNWKELSALMADWASERTSADCEEILSSGGVPCSRYRTLEEAFSDEQVKERGFMVKMDTPSGGYLVNNPPFIFGDGSIGLVPTMPELGEHNEEVFSGW